MAQEWAEAFYDSTEWQKVRGYVVYREHGICQRCGRPGCIVHHRTYLTEQNINDEHITLDAGNLELLCQECHNREHMGKSVTRDGLVFDSNGDLISVGSFGDK